MGKLYKPATSSERCNILHITYSACKKYFVTWLIPTNTKYRIIRYTGIKYASVGLLALKKAEIIVILLLLPILSPLQHVANAIKWPPTNV